MHKSLWRTPTQINVTTSKAISLQIDVDLTICSIFKLRGLPDRL